MTPRQEPGLRSPAGAQAGSVHRFGHGVPGAEVVAGDHLIEVPLDHQDPARGSLTLYAREVRRADLAGLDQPYLLFLQGGPGGRCPLPGVDAPGWLGWALSRYRVVLMDQRGTGRSWPLDRRTLPALAADPASTADLLALFRADSIVADAELLRAHLLGDAPWTVLGQSFGGFCAWTYLSRAPHGLAAAMVTGGVPPVGRTAAEVYRATFGCLDRRVADLDAAHPQARVTLAGVAEHLDRPQTRELLPTGEQLTVARLQEVGIVLGGAAGTDRLAHLAADAWARPGRQLSTAFLAEVAAVVSYAHHPLYALLQESIYAQPGQRTGWAAQQVRQQLGIPTGPQPGDGAAVLPLTGEMVFPHDLDHDPDLRPLAEAGQLLADRLWDRPLYDPVALAANRVPVAACVYDQDVYVDPGLSAATAAATGSVHVVRDGVHHHDGLRRDAPGVLDPLAAALGDLVPAPAPPAVPAGAPPATGRRGRWSRSGPVAAAP